jgi:hypothetical protein
MSFNSNPRQRDRASAVDSRLLIALYVCEAAVLVAALAVHRYYNLLGTLAARQAAMIAAPIVFALASGVYVGMRVMRALVVDRRSAMFAIAVNVLAILLAFTGAEIIIRASSKTELTGTHFGGTLLLPKDWEEVKARHRELLALVRDDISYFVVDDRLGWVPGRSRTSTEGLYSTSTEGFRSAKAGVSLASRPGGPRIAIVGDSFTFGMEVPFESSWGALLERSLGANASVLNLGVDGYGVDQAVLRYERDARAWKPAVAILGFINHDLVRSLSVYPFLSFPEWGLPFTKPRYVLDKGKLRLLTDRLESPARLFSTGSIADLPFVGHDIGWNPDEWTHHSYDASYAVRFLRSRFRRWPAASGDPNRGDIEQLNGAIISKFINMSKADGAVPILIHLPSRVDFSDGNSMYRDTTLRTLTRAGLKYIDLKGCVEAVGVNEAFVPGRPHYSPAGNAAVARCLLPVVRHALARE